MRPPLKIVCVEHCAHAPVVTSAMPRPAKNRLIIMVPFKMGLFRRSHHQQEVPHNWTFVFVDVLAHTETL